MREKIRIAILFLVLSLPALGQTKVSGTVSEKTSDGGRIPVFGAAVFEKGTRNGVAADAEGRYEITVSGPDASLVFSSLGYKETTVAVQGRSKIDVTMESESQALDELVFVGYGYVMKSDLVTSVASVSTEEMMMQPAGTAAEMLRGRAAGVQVRSTSGAPGSVPSITIRGSRSISADNSPLYVIDGAAASDTEFALMNASDIESIEILKDAASQAIYGARASDGVILVTTKRGKAGESTVSYDGYVGVQTLTRNFDFYSSDEWLSLRAEGIANNLGVFDASTLPIATVLNDTIMEQVYKEGGSVDWEKQMFAPALYQNHSVSLRGGNEKFKTAASIGFYDQDGVMVVNSGYRKLSARVNVDYTVRKWLKIGVNSSFGWTRKLVENGAWYQFITRPPLSMLYDENGDYTAEINSKGDKNPLYCALHDQRETVSNNYRLNAFADITLAKGLVWRMNASYYNRVSEAGLFRDQYYPGGGSTASLTSSTRENTLLENILNWKVPVPGKKHSLSLTAVQSVDMTLSKSLGYASENLPADKGWNYVANGENNDMTRTYGENNLISFMGRVQYGYDDRYLFTAALRYDASSRFGDGNKWGLFPSVAAAWRINREEFLQDADWISQLKLRASWGIVGNQNGIDNYATKGLASSLPMEFGDAYIMGYLPGNSLSNKNLKWEKSSTANFGADFGFLDSRITGSAEYYSTVTTDLLVTRSLNQSLGYSSMLDNLGETRSSGIDVNLNFDIIRRKDLSWNASLNFSHDSNRIVRIDDTVDEKGNPVSQPGNNWIIGESINVYYDYKSDGIYQYDDFKITDLGGGNYQFDLLPTIDGDGDGIPEKTLERDDVVAPGSVKIADTDGDGKITINDRVAYKKDPDFTVSLSTTLAWKGFDLFLDVYALKGGYVLNPLLYDNTYGGDLRGQTNGCKIDYWTPQNPSNTFPRPLQQAEIPHLKTRAYQDASYLRLRNVQLGYTLPAKIVSPAGLSKVRFYVSATNLLTLTEVLSYSPEVMASKYPETKQFVLGANISF